MEFLSSFPDAEFDLSRYFCMEDQADHHHFFLSQSDHQYCSSSWNNNLMNHSPSSNCSSNNSAAALDDPAPAAAVTNFSTQLEFANTYYGGAHQNYDNFLSSTNFINVEEQEEAANLAMNFCVMENPVVHVASMDCDDQPLKRKLNIMQSSEEEVAANPSDKKRPRATKDNKGKNTQWKKNQKCIVNDEEESKNNGQSSSSCNSEEENHVSMQEQHSTHNNIGDSKVVGAQKSNRASRGSATDPQSLYARKRRERINERLRILQNLVPNGTKVDISTMLEEAVHYVKFLQIQIKLLSSDDMWMYAPIAYNGVDVGLNEKFSNLL